MTLLKPLTVWFMTNCGIFFKRWNTRPPYLPPENPICETKSKRARHGISEWFKIEKGVSQGCILLPCLFNPYAEYIKRNTGLDEAQAGIKIARREINNFRYANSTTVIPESEEALRSLLMKVKEESGKLA